MGAVDLHFHGAFGIDLMTASDSEHDSLSEQLWSKGLAGYCATTLSAGPGPLAETVSRLGTYIRRGRFPGAHPLGIHLEGPFLNTKAAGAHPSEIIRKLDFRELERLWDLSQKTLKILTIAPETLSKEEREKLVAWSRPKGIVLSLGHSRATEAEAREAFDQGFSGLTHAWNALSFHHRAPGPLGAALGRKGLHVELILDRIHVAPSVIRWVLKLHDEGTCFVSDCAPAAATDGGSWHSFGGLKHRFHQGACRLEDESLAGGGLLLPHAYSLWIASEAGKSPSAVKALWKQTSGHLTEAPLRALGWSNAQIKAFAKTRSVRWKFDAEAGISITSSS